MDITTDKVFVQAVATIKSLTDLSKSTGLPRPSINDRLNLYGLYNQSTRGDITTIHNDLNIINNPTELKKYNSWLKFKGLSKSEARNRYIKYLLNILNNNYSNVDYSELIELKSNLQDSWDKLENLNLSLKINKHPIEPHIPLSIDSSRNDDSTNKYNNNNNENDQGNNNLPNLNSSNINNSNASNITRRQSPAASLFRIASSGINSNIIKPPSRNQSISKSRQNSINGSTTNLNPILSLTNPSNQIQPNNNYNKYNNSVNSLDFIKWQDEINNTLLKISTELSSLKLQNSNNDAGHRSISGSTTLSVQSDIQNYKMGYNDFNDKYNTSYFNNNKIKYYNLNSELTNNNNNNSNNNNNKEGIMRWIYWKMIKLIKYLRETFHAKFNINSIANNLITPIVTLLFLSIFKKIVDVYFKRRFGMGFNNGKSLIHQWKLWIIGMIQGRNSLDMS